MTNRWHNIIGPVDPDQLRAYLVNLRKLNEAIQDLNGKKSLIYKEAKACGIDVKIVRLLLRRERVGRATIEEQDEILRAYEDIAKETTDDKI